MSFIGLITRKEKDTGVSLRAKIVTPNKKKSAEKIFKVKVKANALDDYSCCVIDLATVKEKLETSQDMSQLINNVTLTYNGANGTTISYKIIDDTEPLLSSYLNEDGKISGRPKFGEGDATGTIVITVSKNEEAVESSIGTGVKAITAEEVLNDTTFTQAALWTAIRGTNDTYQQGSEWSGHNNIANTLNLIKSKEVASMSITPVTIAWSVDDKTLNYASINNIYTEPRIDASTGVVNRCSYKDACKLVDAIAGIDIRVIGSNNSAWQNRVRIGGITLTAVLTLGEVTKTVVFNCSTISKYLTNEEILDVVLANICLYADDNTRIDYKETAGTSYETITAPPEGGNYTLRAYGNSGSETFQASELKLDVGDIVGVTITNEVRDFNGSSSYADTSLLTTAFNNGFQNDEGEIYSKLVINLDAIKNASAELKKFSCSTSVSVAGYSANGLVPGGSSYNASRYAQFVIDTDAIESSSPSVS